MLATIRNNETNKIAEIPVPTNRRKSLLAPNNFNHLRRVPLSEMSNMGLVLVQAWREAGGLFDARERAALAWAETVTRVADTAVPDDEFMAASAVFSEKELADLTIAIGLMNAYNRLAIGFRNTPSAVRNVDAARCGEQE